MLEAIKEIVGESRFFTADAIGADYCHDECPGVAGTPDAVAEVTSTEQAAAVVKLCAEAGVPVTVRGAGTGQAGGSVPVSGGVVLSLKAMDQILEFGHGLVIDSRGNTHFFLFFGIFYTSGDINGQRAVYEAGSGFHFHKRQKEARF